MIVYEYLISFVYDNGYGSVCLSRTTKIDTIDKISEITKAIEKNNNLKKVIINNYKLIREYELKVDDEQ